MRYAFHPKRKIMTNKMQSDAKLKELVVEVRRLREKLQSEFRWGYHFRGINPSNNRPVLTLVHCTDGSFYDFWSVMYCVDGAWYFSDDDNAMPVDIRRVVGWTELPPMEELSRG